MRRTVLVGVLCLLMMLVLTVLGFFSFPYKQFVFSLVSILMFLSGSWFLKKLTPDQKTKKFFKIRPPKFRDFFLVLWFALALVFGSFILNFVTSVVCRQLGSEAASQLILSFAEENIVLSVFSIAIIPAVFEELFFRGAVCSYLAEKGMLFSVLVSAAFFMMMHGIDAYFLSTFYAGILLALVVYLTNNLFSAMIVHLINNVMTYVLILYAEKLAIVKMDYFMLYSAGFLLIVSVIGILTSILRRYKKKNAKQKIKASEESEPWENEQQKVL